MRLRIHPGASAEIRKEALYYEQQAPGLGTDFLQEIDNSVERIAAHPEQFPASDPNLKKCVLERFPFSILFREKPGLVEILVVRHDARHPSYGHERL